MKALRGLQVTTRRLPTQLCVGCNHKRPLFTIYLGGTHYARCQTCIDRLKKSVGGAS